MFKNEVTLLKKENLRQMENVKEDDEDIIYEIMKSMSVFKVNSYDAQVIQRDLIGMAQDSELRGTNLKNVIGNDIKSFSNEIIKNSYGPSTIEILLNFLICYLDIYLECIYYQHIYNTKVYHGNLLLLYIYYM